MLFLYGRGHPWTYEGILVWMPSTPLHRDFRNGEASNIYERIFEDLPHEKECIDVKYDQYGDHVYNIEDMANTSSNQKQVTGDEIRASC